MQNLFSGAGSKTYQINLSGIDGMERRVGSDLDFTFSTVFIADVLSRVGLQVFRDTGKVTVCEVKAQR